MVLRKLPSGGRTEADGFEIINNPLPHRQRLSTSSTVVDKDNPLPHPQRLSTSSTVLDKDESSSTEPKVHLHKLPIQNEIIVSVDPPLKPADESIRHVPCDIVLSIDVSASMSHVPPLPDAQKDSKEQSYLSVLDLAKHSARTIISTLTEKDRLGVVVFSTQAETVYELSYMTKESKAWVLKVINGLKPLASTNLWHGLKEGLRVLETASPVPENIQALYLLTDGQPNNMCPKQGYIPKLRQVLQDQQSRDKKPLPSIHTFGFGNDIRSGLLQAIAELGTGTFSFIPDIGMLGTVFVHAVANLYTTFATQATLTLDTEDTIKFTSNDSGLQLHEKKNSEPGKFTLNIGNLQYGQSRNILLRYESTAKRNPYADVELTYNFQNSTQTVLSKRLLFMEEKSLSPEVGEYHQSRARVCAALRSVFPTVGDSDYKEVHPDKRSKLIGRFGSLAQELKANGHRDEQNVSLYEDLAGEDPHGQAGLALSTREYYVKWGKHYLLSLLNAHTHQICNSFKDPGPLQYGKDSPLFISCRKELDDSFDNLPAPKPTGHLAHTVTTPVSMARYNRSSNPCFAGHCVVRLAGEKRGSIAIRDLRAGMSVWTPRGPRSVEAVVATRVRDIVLCKVGGSLSVTPWHPIQQVYGSWVFPCDVSKECIPFTGDIYSVMLSPGDDPEGHAIMVGEKVCVTLGHGILSGRNDDEGDVRAHGFFGDYQRVAQSLGMLPVDSEGVLRCGGIQRDEVTGLACGFVRDERLPGTVQSQTESVEMPVQRLPEIVVS